MVLPLDVEACGEEFIGELTRPGQAVDTFADSEVDPPFPIVRANSVFMDEVFSDVGDFDTDILVAVEGCVQLEVGDVKYIELVAFAIENTVDGGLDNFERSSGGSDVSWVEDYVAKNCDASAAWILFVGLDFADNFGVDDFVPAVRGDVLVVDDEEVIGAKDALTCSIGASSNAVAQAAKFVGVRSVSSVHLLGVLADLDIFE